MSKNSGRFVWRELTTPDTAGAAKFYGDLFGWSSSDMEMGPGMTYTMLRNDELGEDVAGAMAPQMDGMPAHWLDYITVDDIDASLTHAVELGGSKLAGPMEVPGMGRWAVVQDPTGAVFGLFTSQTPGATDTDRRPPDHTFCWSQLMSRDVEAAVPFYNALFGWTSQPMDGGMVVFSNDGKTVASAMPVPADAAAPNHWLKYVAVPDTDAAWVKAQSLGATGFHAPTDIPGMGRFAVLADPTGAGFAVWKDFGDQG